MPMLMTGTNLRDTITTYLEKYPGTPPSAIAGQVLAEIGNDPEALTDALTECLTGYVAQIITTHRNTTLRRVLDPPAVISHRVKGVRDWYAQLMQETLHVAPGDGGYKTIGSCTRADLMFAVNEREATAAKIQRRADQYRALADLLPDDTTTVAALNPTLARAALGGT